MNLYVRTRERVMFCCAEHGERPFAHVEVIAPTGDGVEGFTVVALSRAAALGRACAFLRKKGLLGKERPQIVEFRWGGLA